MRLCEFRDDEGFCFQAKKDCKCQEKNQIEKCKYYLRQYPKNQANYDARFKKALKKALEKRDFYGRYKDVLEISTPDYNISIWENIRKIMDKFDKISLKIKDKRKVQKEDLTGDILTNLAMNLYEIKDVQILEKYDESNSIKINENGHKYLCRIQDPLTTFFKKIKENKNPEEYIKRNIKEKIAI